MPDLTGRGGSSHTLVRRLRRLAVQLGFSEPTYEEAFRPNRLYGPGGFSAGKWTYWNHESGFWTFSREDRIEIGAFTSFAAGTKVIAGGEHDISALTSFPLAVMSWLPGQPKVADTPASKVLIGSDVWIGAGAIVLGGVTIGDGAVVGAGSVVTHHIPAYAVVAGVPARVLRYRFSEEEIRDLSRLRWWDWSDEEIRMAGNALASASVNDLLALANEWA